MASEEQNLTLVQRLAKVRKAADTIVKNKSGFKYTYADLTAILAKITAGMEKYGVSLIPTIEPGTSKVEKVVSVNTKVDKAGQAYDNTATEMMFSAEMTYLWVNEDDFNDQIEVPWFAVASMPDVAQAMGSALTYTMRYFMANYFQIAVLDDSRDVDAYRSKQKEAEMAEDRALAEEIISKVDVLVNDYLAKKPDDRPGVIALIQKYVKSADYKKIKDATLAAKLLGDFKKSFLDKAEPEKKETKGKKETK